MIDQLFALHNQGRYAEGEALARALIASFPNHGFLWKVLGVMLKQQGQLEEALEATRTAARLSPDDVETHSNMGGILNALGRLQEAEASLRRVLQQTPGYCGAHNNLGVTLYAQGKLQEAEASYRKALELNPEYAEAHCNLGAVLHAQERHREAADSQRKALEIRPDYADAYGYLGRALDAQGMLKQAETSYRQALALNGDLVDIHVCLANNLMEQRRSAEAIESFRTARQIEPDSAEIHHCLLFCLDHDEAADPATLFLEHRRFGLQFETPLKSAWPRHANSREPERCLRLGFLSGDFRNHAVAHFIESVLENLARDATLSLHAYANHDIDDEVTERLKRHFAVWNPVSGLSDLALAEKIRGDRIDILLDLSGHTAKNRLLTLARKPAPLQVGWIGYPGTTGLEAMDYCFKSECGTPAGMLDDQYIEKVIRVPVHTAFQPAPDAPEVNALPALTKGCFTFGSFNRAIKISTGTMDLWARVLRALPESRMVIGYVNNQQIQAQLREDFRARGIDGARVTFYPHVDMRTYLAMHGEIDVMLDTFPYCGSTTTRHALWMGVPVVSLAGPTPPQRQGAAALGPVGMQDWIAATPDEYVARAQAAAADLSELVRLRAALRGKMMKAGLNQPQGAARYISAALRIIWKRWCAGLPAEGFILNDADIRN